MSAILSMMYEDILEFHRCALRFFNRPGEPVHLLLQQFLILSSMAPTVSSSLEGFPS